MECDSFVDEGLCGLFQEARGLARTEAMHHLIVGGQLLLWPIQLVERDPLVEEGLRNRFKQTRGLARTEAAHHLIVGGQLLLWPIQPVERDPFVDEGLCRRFEQDRVLTRPESEHYLVKYGQCFLCSVLVLRLDRFNDPHLRRPQLGECSHLLGRLAGRRMLRLHVDQHRSHFVQICRDMIEIFYEICGGHCEQFFTLPGQLRQTDQTRERPKVEGSHPRFLGCCFAGDPGTDVLQLTRRVAQRHEADQGFDQVVRPAFAPQQVIDVVQALAQVVLLAPNCAACDLDDAAFDEAGELGAALARFKPRPIRDLLRERRLPEVGEREVDPPFLGWEQFEVTLEVLRVIIDQVEQVSHELVEGQPSTESSQDREQARAAAGEDFQ